MSRRAHAGNRPHRARRPRLQCQVCWGERWGATANERATPLACDQLLPDAPVRLHRAVSVDAPAPLVFRWLKLAPYSYDMIDNLGRTSPRELVAGTDQLEVGQRFMVIFSLASFARDRHITLRSARTAVTYATIPTHGLRGPGWPSVGRRNSRR
jgi:hypothetical protein